MCDTTDNSYLYNHVFVTTFWSINVICGFDFIHKSYEVSRLSVTFADSTGWINRLLAPDLQPLPNFFCLANVNNVPFRLNAQFKDIFIY
jgi:hypothetical protein